MNDKKHTVLVVEDDKDISKAVKRLLELDDKEVLCAFDGEQAIAVLENNEIDLIILDVMLPKIDGLVALKKIRASECLPIIMLSAKTESNDIVLGLELGADDYVKKPFNPSELIARVNVALRRNSNKVVDEENILTTGELMLNTKTKQAIVNGEEVALTKKEYEILYFLMRNMGNVFNAEEIYSAVWKEDPYLAENTVMVHIRKIRKKIEINPKESKYLKVVWGVGYKIERY